MSGTPVHKITVDLAYTDDLLSEVEEGVFDCLDEVSGLPLAVESGYLTVTFEYSRTPEVTRGCKCGDRGTVHTGKRWFCATCFGNGDDEDA
jgi:hypothetical protein